MLTLFGFQLPLFFTKLSCVSDKMCRLFFFSVEHWFNIEEFIKVSHNNLLNSMQTLEHVTFWRLTCVLLHKKTKKI
jgi:hypothetical protein